MAVVFFRLFDPSESVAYPIFCCKNNEQDLQNSKFDTLFVAMGTLIPIGHSNSIL